MAIEAPAHAEGLIGAHDRHLVDTAVAIDAAHAFVDVCAVVEVGKVGELVDANPLDRLTGLVSIHNFLNFSRAGFGARLDQGVAIHARLGRGDPAVATLFHIEVAIAAIHTEFAGVQLVAEGDRLNRLIADKIVLRGAPIGKGEYCETNERDHGYQQDKWDLVGPLREYHSACLQRRVSCLHSQWFAGRIHRFKGDGIFAIAQGVRFFKRCKVKSVVIHVQARKCVFILIFRTLNAHQMSV